ncbi:MAG TPA: trehalose-6-phosphate synthase [Terriglobia bacterium]|nr:trehalose-6-phosphate synthase [Terriglobia bacterium]
MRVSVRLIASLIAGVTLVTFLFARSQVQAERNGLRNDLERRAEVLGESLADVIGPLETKRPLERLQERHLREVIERYSNRKPLVGVAIYDERGNPFAVSSKVTQQLIQDATIHDLIARADQESESFVHFGQTTMLVFAMPLYGDFGPTGKLVIFSDASYIQAQSLGIWRKAVWHVLLQVLIITTITLLIVRWSIVTPLARTAHWLREISAGRKSQPPDIASTDLMGPLSHEVMSIARSLAEARAAAEEEARLREAGESLWTSDRLRIHVQGKLQHGRLFVVSNREPYEHVLGDRGIEVMVPASGLVTAIEPVLVACDGTWIAHGAGSADTQAVDEHDRLRVPPERPQYTLRRVWLSQEEEEGYYYGFANEGLWPLCHIAHTRPIFRAADWDSYQAVNRKFARAVRDEMEGTEEPFLLVQDYHFALLPRLVKEVRPDARVGIFWHIPWPNPQAFGICPWRRELIEGLLGADLIGFHIQSHCNYFLETVDSSMESRIDREHFAVNRAGHRTLVKPFPISVAFSDAPETNDRQPLPDRATLFRQLGVEAAFLGVGVDRIDYTKGILERFRGLERFFEKNPGYREKFTFVQIGAPSRTRIKTYSDLMAEVEWEAERINERFQAGKWRPIVFLKRHHSHQEIDAYYRAAHLCMVTSLHDGMNLVAKEFVASRDDEQGALILSGFTGASRELRDAIIVNPYDTEALADAIRTALDMDPVERNARMQRMRRVVKDHNIYRWAASLIAELSEIRIEKPERVAATTQ